MPHLLRPKWHKQAPISTSVFLPRTQTHKGKLSSTSAQRARKTWGACFQTPGRQVTLLHEESRYHQAGPLQHTVSSGKCISQLLLDAEVCWQSLTHREARSTSGYHCRKEGETAILRLLMKGRTFLLVRTAFSTPLFWVQTLPIHSTPL